MNAKTTKAVKTKAVLNNTINLQTYLLMQATVFGAPSPKLKHLDIKGARELVDEMLKHNGVSLEAEAEE